jgi:hypothetical protein
VARRLLRAIPVVLAITVVAAGLSTGFGAGGDPRPAAAVSFRMESASPPVLAGGWTFVPPPPRPADFSVGVAQVPDLHIYEFPGVPYRIPVLDGANVEGFEVVLPVALADGAWLRVYTQINASGERAFVTRDDMTVSTTAALLLIERSLGRLTLFEGEDIRFSERAALGAPNTPTPTGAFYVESVVDLPDDDPAGHAVLRLGAFTDINDRRPVRNVPVIGGTDDAAILGQPVTTGGIAVSNATVEQLLALVKPGTPVQILP